MRRFDSQTLSRKELLMKTGTLVSSLRISSLLVVSFALLPVDKRKRNRTKQGLSAPIATDVVDSERTAQAVDPTQFAVPRRHACGREQSAFGGANLWHNKLSGGACAQGNSKLDTVVAGTRGEHGGENF